jgi:hypothetical protein
MTGHQLKVFGWGDGVIRRDHHAIAHQQPPRTRPLGKKGFCLTIVEVNLDSLDIQA